MNPAAADMQFILRLCDIDTHLRKCGSHRMKPVGLLVPDMARIHDPHLA